jgi:acetyl-CoA C-acetyltransferase
MSVRTLGALVGTLRPARPAAGRSGDGRGDQAFVGLEPGREAALSSGLSPLTPGITLQRACGTSLDTIITVANKIAPGRSRPASAAVRTPPPTCRSSTARRCARACWPPTAQDHQGDKLAAFKGFRFSELKPEFPGVAEPRTGKSMGQHCEDMAKEWNISRDSQDELGGVLAPQAGRRLRARLLRRPGGAVPRRGARQHPAPGQQLEKLATLKPAFDKTSGRGTLTAANSTPLTDGAAAVPAGQRRMGRGAWPRSAGHLRDAQVAAVDFVHGEGLLMAPTVAVPKCSSATA